MPVIIPQRIRLSRAKGFDLQAVSLALNGLPAVNVARPSACGNPFITGKDGTAADCVDLFLKMLGGYLALSKSPSILEQQKACRRIRETLASLRGNNLACWCKAGQPCHADVLLEIANRQRKKILVIQWEWIAGEHKGSRFWGAHAFPDGRIRDWPATGLKPIGAAEVDVIEGHGLELLAAHIAPETPAS